MLTLEAPIAAVTVFMDRARITRRGRVQVPAGEQTLTLTGLPATLEEDSVRAAGRGAGVRLLGVEVTTQFVARPPEATLAALQEQLRGLEDADQALADDHATVAARIEFLRALRESSAVRLARAFAEGKATLDSVRTLAGYLDGELDAAQARGRACATQRRALAQELDALHARLAQVQPGAAPVRRAIQVTVEAAAETPLDLEIVYAVRGASWTPLYDIRLVERRIALTYLAAVRQQSGEDWPAVPLSLSTARPAVSATIPRLVPWYLDTYRPPVGYPQAPAQAAPVARSSVAPGAPAHMAPPADLEAPPAEAAEAEIESGGAAVTYRVARAVAVPADGAPHRTTVTVLDFDAQLDYVTVPKLAAEAYLRARIKNTSAYALLPGPAGIFHDADFVGSTAIKTVAPNETFEVPLGVDDRLKVTRELIERTTAKAALVGNLKRTQLAYKITLTNHLAGPATVTVYDQVPVPRHEEIKVRLLEIVPRPAEQNALHILQWTLTLDPQETREITFAYTVEHPRAMQVTGLDGG